MENDTFNLELALEVLTLEQQRTSENKPFTFLNGDIVIKGPYKWEQVEKILSRSETLKDWNAPFIIHPIKYLKLDTNVTSKKPEIISLYRKYISSGNIFFLVYPNVSRDYPVEVEKYKYVESFKSGSVQYSYQKRINIQKLNKVWDDKYYDKEWIYDLIPYMIMTMICLYVLGVGDTGISNILVDINKKFIYIIDYDEDIKFPRDTDNTEYFYFVTLPAENVRKIWSDRSAKNKKFIMRYR